MIWELSIYRSARDAQPRRVALDWQGLVELLSQHADALGVADKRELPAWSPAVLEPGARRANDAVESLSAIVLDYDQGDCSAAEAVAPWSSWPTLAHTSWSHQPGAPRFRLVVPLARPCPRKAWRWVWGWAAERAAGTIDGSCKDASRLYFLPAAPRLDAERWAVVHDPGGELCDPDWHRQPDDVLAAAGKPPTPPRPATPAVVGSDRQLEQLAREALRNDPAARLRAAQALGARLTSERAYGVRCPRCNDASVWWLLAPEARSSAECNHKNSCGWYGWIDQLIGGGA